MNGDDGDERKQPDRKRPPGRLWGLLPSLDPAQRREVLGSLFFPRSERREGLTRFAVLLTLSVVIASYGILSDSSAVVIGAMLIAPLMTPILGMAAALVMGWWRRFALVGIQVAAATGGVVALSLFTSILIPDDAITILPNELTARTSPTLLDLGIALAAGAAGAYVLIHRAELAALPGVAVSVALVPPLVVVGLSLELGEGDMAKGALWLYLTNQAGIVLAAMVVFILNGFIPERQMQRVGRRIRLGLIVATLAVLVVLIPLAINSEQIVSSARSDASIADQIGDWLGDETRLEVVELETPGHDIIVTLAGPEMPPPGQLLEDSMIDRLGDDGTLTIRWVESFEEIFGPEGR